MISQHIFNTIISFLLLTRGSGGAKPCISIDVRGHCYQIVDTNTTWATASRICKEKDGHLIFIETAEEQQVIKDQMQKRNFTAVALWIGSANVHADDGPRWDNGESFTYVNWAKGEPNNKQYVEKCAEISTSDFTWNDQWCSNQKGYICELPQAIEPCRTVGNIRHCYQIVQDEITWLQAFKMCSQVGGMLVTIESKAEQMFLEDQMQNKNFTVAGLWIGANKLHPENQRVWINGHQFTYVNWAQGAPNNRQYVENCAEISTSDFTWNDEMCSTQRGYVCEYPSTSDLQVWVIIVAVGSALVLLVGVFVLCSFLKRRRQNQKKKKVEVYQGLKEMEMRNADHLYNATIDLSVAYTIIDDYISRPDENTHNK
ncbi:hypothetical protein ACJMK2_022565 [Sinanodonta woodiana]|uniref:C-type lectin domain-containing protein n=1 Tax=Sinanodonta woodiana TaxID=1069815 RepID=A0ABD3TJI7_SINWO